MTQQTTIRPLQNGRLFDISGQVFDPFQLTRLEATQLRDQLTVALRKTRP